MTLNTSRAYILAYITCLEHSLLSIKKKEEEVYMQNVLSSSVTSNIIKDWFYYAFSKLIVHLRIPIRNIFRKDDNL